MLLKGLHRAVNSEQDAQPRSECGGYAHLCDKIPTQAVTDMSIEKSVWPLLALAA